MILHMLLHVTPSVPELKMKRVGWGRVGWSTLGGCTVVYWGGELSFEAHHPPFIYGPTPLSPKAMGPLQRRLWGEAG